ncbi:MAG: hypothetical protein K2G01_02170, partial [Paramuribaculum sp.]|nr:hypothetical protein [Paramuribaculum sp.]
SWTRSSISARRENPRQKQERKTGGKSVADAHGSFDAVLMLMDCGELCYGCIVYNHEKRK